jgi:hypothetical protein
LRQVSRASSRSLSFDYVSLRYAVDSWEDTAMLGYQKALTIMSNDAPGSLADATALLMADLKKRGFVN